MAPQEEISCRYTALRDERQNAPRDHRHSDWETNKQKMCPVIETAFVTYTQAQAGSNTQARILLTVIANGETFRCRNLLKNSSSGSHHQGSVWDRNSEHTRPSLFSHYNDLT